jgi:hypothetical protein
MQARSPVGPCSRRRRGARTVTVARRLLPFVLVLAALAAIVYAGTLGTGRERCAAPTRRRAPRPADGSPVAVRQAEVGVDLAPAGRGPEDQRLEIPEDQLARVEAQNEVYFQPGRARRSRLPTGTIVVEAEIWRSPRRPGRRPHRRVALRGRLRASAGAARHPPARRLDGGARAASPVGGEPASVAGRGTSRLAARRPGGSRWRAGGRSRPRRGSGSRAPPPW